VLVSVSIVSIRTSFLRLRCPCLITGSPAIIIHYFLYYNLYRRLHHHCDLPRRARSPPVHDPILRDRLRQRHPLPAGVGHSIIGNLSLRGKSITSFYDQILAGPQPSSFVPGYRCQAYQSFFSILSIRSWLRINVADVSRVFRYHHLFPISASASGLPLPIPSRIETSRNSDSPSQLYIEDGGHRLKTSKPPNPSGARLSTPTPSRIWRLPEHRHGQDTVRWRR
jgi:hypothetical protein